MSTPEEIQASRRRATRAAAAGEMSAAAWLGMSYERHERRDKHEARHWIRVAAEQGHRGAMVRHARLLHLTGQDTSQTRRWLGQLTDLGHVPSRELLAINLARREPVDLDAARAVASSPELRSGRTRLLSMITDLDWRRAAGPVLGTERSSVTKPYVTMAGWPWDTDVRIGDATIPLSVEYDLLPVDREFPRMWHELLDQGWLVVLLRDEQHGPCGLSHERFLEVLCGPWRPHRFGADIEPDEDGDFPLFLNGVRLWVRVADDRPAILLGCGMLDGLMDHQRADTELNVLNRSSFWVRWFRRGGRMYQELQVPGRPFSPSQFDQMLAAFVDAAQTVRPDLVDRLDVRTEK